MQRRSNYNRTMPNYVTSLKNLRIRNRRASVLTRTAFLSVILVVSLLAACAPVRPNIIGEPVSQAVADGLMQEWSTHTNSLNSVQGLAKVNVQTPLDSVHGNQVILTEKPDHLRAETLSPFGTSMMLLAADGTTLGVSLPSQNLFYTGDATPENLDLFVHLPLRLRDLVEVLLYQPPILNSWKEEAFTLQDGGWLLIRQGTSQRQELVFNPARQLVEVSYFMHNDMFLKISYARFPNQGEPFPRLLKLEIPEKQATISLEFSDLELNAKIRNGIFQLAPPPGAKVVYLPSE